MANEDNIISLQEAFRHNTSDDLWIIIRNKVYDVTSFLKEHPGGEDVLVEVSGKDATQDFIDVGHSKAAEDLMKKFCIGKLSSADIARLGRKNKVNIPIGVGIAVLGLVLGVATIFIVRAVLKRT